MGTEDVNAALRLMNCESLFGFSSLEPLEFRPVEGHSDLFFVSDRELKFDDISMAQLPPPPLDTNLVRGSFSCRGISTQRKHSVTCFDTLNRCLIGWPSRACSRPSLRTPFQRRRTRPTEELCLRRGGRRLTPLWKGVGS